MKFNNIEELILYVNESGIDLSSYDVRFAQSTPEPQLTEKQETIACSILMEDAYRTIPLADESVIVVQECENIENMCGSAKIMFECRELYVAMCDMEGVKHVTLPITVNGKVVYESFKVEIGEKSSLRLRASLDPSRPDAPAEGAEANGCYEGR